MNKIILTGRLTKDPEVKYTQAGKAVASFTLAVNRMGKDAGADFFSVVAWEKLAEVCGNNLGKGRRILVEGRLQNRSYEATDGQKRYITEVVAQNIEFLDSKAQNENTSDTGGASSMGSEVFPEEEIPF